MKRGWGIKKLGDICHTSNGLWKGKKPPFITIGVLRSTNFTKDCRLKLDDVAYIEVEENSFAKRKLQKNDIVVERSGGGPNQPVGRVLLFDIDDDNFSFCNFTSALRVIDSSYISPIYLHKYLSYFYLSGKTIEMQSNTIGLRNLDYTKYLDIEIPIPPLAEQERIVEILDREFERIDALKANAEKSLQHAKDLLKQSQNTVFNSIETFPLDSMVTIINGYAFKSEDFSKTNPVKAVKITNVGVGVFIETIDTNLPQSLLLDKQDYTVHTGDIVFALTRTIIAAGLKVAIVPESYNCALLNQRVAALRIDDDIQRKYLYNYFQTASVKEYVLKKVNTLMQPNLSIKDLKAMPIPYCNRAEMEQVVARLDKLKEHCTALEENYTKTIALCDDMKQALLRKAFNGEL